MKDKSKMIRKTNEASKEFIMSLLEGSETHGIDVDCVYFTKNGWIIFEFLKCDTVDPYDSHPNRYPFNWRKFATLFELSKKLKGRLYLVNYSYLEKWKNHIKIIYVKMIYYDKVRDASWEDLRHYIPYLETEDIKMTLEDFKEKFNKLNSEAIGPWE